MTLSPNKTKIICTIGPASEDPDIMKEMIRKGMNVARLNFSHGSFSSHKTIIRNLRDAAQSVGRSVAILADLSGPKIRIGDLVQSPVVLKAAEKIVLSTDDFVGDAERLSLSFSQLPQVVSRGNMIFLNDGYIQLEVCRVEDKEVVCRVVVGGELRSRQGVNLPGIDLGIGAFTDNDRRCLEFALQNGVDAISQSFVEKAADVHEVREAAETIGHHPFIIAKIERAGVMRHIDEILEASDGIMIARGDLGVEMPIVDLPVIQKELTKKANLAGKPVITATQMLESMIRNRRPTRAEATDVANAILDGTDCVMLSGESAIGNYPVDAVSMLAGIAAAIEPLNSAQPVRDALYSARRNADTHLRDLIALSVETTARHASPTVVIVPTQSGATARSIARFRLPMWVTAVSSSLSTCQSLQFSYGVQPVYAHEYPADWKVFAREWLHNNGEKGDIAILTEGPSSRHPDANNRMEIIELHR